MDFLSPLPDNFKLPGQMPAMILSDCYLFPGCFLPLFIFEERYRLMLQHALQSDRMFCIGTRAKSNQNDILPWSTAGLIRACVRQPDGTSHLMLYGVSRVEIKGWEQDQPFHIAQVEPIAIQTPSRDAIEPLRQQALDLLPTPTPACSEAMQSLKQTLSKIDCPDRVCDILAYHFVRDAKAIKTLLAESDPVRRYQTLIAELRRL
jgi:Lon protease-like protein